MLEMTDMARFTGRPAGKLSGGMKQKCVGGAWLRLSRRSSDLFGACLSM